MCLPWSRRSSEPKKKLTSSASSLSPSQTHFHSKPQTTSIPMNTNVTNGSAFQANNSKPQPFSKSSALSLFVLYQDADVSGGEDVIGPEGLERLCTDMDLDMEGAKPIVLAWLMHSKELGKISKEEWVECTSQWEIDTCAKMSQCVNDLHDVLFAESATTNHRSASPTKSRTKSVVEPYNKRLFSDYARQPDTTFKKFYMSAFELAKSESARNIDMETATALWSVLLAPKYPVCSSLLEFITEKGTYKGVNKDLWSMTLEFCGEFSTSEKFEEYESDNAWPLLMDEFVAHQKDRKT